MDIQCDDCGEEAKWTERECPNCGRPLADQQSGLIKKVHSRVHKLSDILIEDPSLFRKSGLQLKKAWDNYDPYEISKAKPSSRKRTLYVSSIYAILAFFCLSALILVSAPLVSEAPEEGGGGPGEAEVANDTAAVEADEAESSPDEESDSDWDTDSDESSTSDLDSDVTSLDDLENELREGDIQVDYFDGGEDYLLLDYITAVITDEKMRQEVETVAVAYAEFVNSGGSHGLIQLDVIFMDSYGNDLGGFFILHEWAQDYADGDISKEEYVEMIIDETLGYE